MRVCNAPACVPHTFAWQLLGWPASEVAVVSTEAGEATPLMQVYKQADKAHSRHQQHLYPYSVALILSLSPSKSCPLHDSLDYTHSDPTPSLTMAASRRSHLGLASCLILAAALMLSAVPKTHAGAVFEIREDISKNDQDYKFQFDQVQSFGPIGSIVRSAGTGAGAVFKTSAIPLAVFTLNRCSAVAPHIHPNAAETLFVLQGKIRITQFRGEEDGNNVHVVELGPGEAGYIQQGAYHVVENISKGTAQFLQIFDHPQGGAVFAAPALANLPRAVVNSAFSKDVLAQGVTANGALISVRDCAYAY